MATAAVAATAIGVLLLGKENGDTDVVRIIRMRRLNAVAGWEKVRERRVALGAL